MSIFNKYFNKRINPLTGEYEPKHIISGDLDSDYPYIQVPSTENEPEETPTRLVIELPEVPDLSDEINRPFKIYKNSISSPNLLTRVAGIPSVDNTFCVGLSSTGRGHCLILSPNLKSQNVFYDYYGIEPVINASNLNTFITQEILAKVKVSTEEIIAHQLATDELILNSFLNNQILLYNEKIIGSGISFEVNEDNTLSDSHEKSPTSKTVRRFVLNQIENFNIDIGVSSNVQIVSFSPSKNYAYCFLSGVKIGEYSRTINVKIQKSDDNTKYYFQKSDGTNDTSLYIQREGSMGLYSLRLYNVYADKSFNIIGKIIIT